VRALPSFVRFLHVAALYAGHFLDLSKISQKAKVPRQSAVRHFEILEDTMIAYRVPPDPYCAELDLVKHPKFYFFDTGVLNGLLGNFIASPDRMGLLFEHTFASQIFASCHARDITPDLFTFRTRGGLEIDFILRLNQTPIAIELKSSTSIHSSDVTGFERALKTYPRKLDGYLVYRGSKEQKHGKIWILPWTKFFKAVGL
jgi:predicted AAA+ superfamily ATPase